MTTYSPVKPPVCLLFLCVCSKELWIVSIMPRVSFAPPSLCLAFLSLLNHYLPSLPPTVRDIDVPSLHRQQFIPSGYRPVGLSWRCCVLSLFQIHNETLNVWSHLLAAVCQGISVDFSSLPLVLYVFSAVTYLSCSAAAHLLQSHSEQAHYSLFFLNYMGVGIYQYGCALALCLYSSYHSSCQFLQIFLPAAAVLAWFSCATCCFAKFYLCRLYPLHRQLFQVVPLAVTYLLVISPVVHRLIIYSQFYEVVLFLLSAFFFSCPIPEYFFPGRYDIFGHSHQLFHILLSFCMLTQQEALFQDFLWQRQGLVREFGEKHLLMACVSFACLLLCCMMTALIMTIRAQAQLTKGLRYQRDICR
uniref:Uncharacterized protein n=1 Tax=Anabas testudineus TaxID=64144 RepID=A0A3Q1IP91_ANATE